MVTLRTLALCALVTFISLHQLLLAVAKPADDGDDDDTKWQNFKRQHGKQFRDQQEDNRRKGNYFANVARNAEHNKRFNNGQEKYSVDVNEYSDMDEAEFNAIMNGFIRSSSSRPVARSIRSTSRRQATLPASVDWRTSGAVTAIKNQGKCGSCWAFSATGALEGQKFRRTGILTSMSEQNLVDCARSAYGSYGCNGGSIDGSFDYVKFNNGFDTRAGYPYLTKMQATCNYTVAYNTTTCRGTNWVDPTESALQVAVATAGPISVAVDASLASFQAYKSGVYSNVNCSSINLNHGVLVVGYGTLNGTDHWIIKNSWGTTWGMSGYMYLARNANNMCGVAEYATYPAMW